ncbi:MAG: hypothetical protein AAF125_13595, partial [Chloroflexota bacterium]
MTSKTSWTKDFVVTDNDIEFLNTLLLEKEIPLDIRTLATAIVKENIRRESVRLAEHFKNASLYDPAFDYEVGEKLVFPAFDYAMGEVAEVRSGENSEYGEFDVIAVMFEENRMNEGDKLREFAANFPLDHNLNALDTDDDEIPIGQDLDLDAVLQSDFFYDLLDQVDDRLQEDESLTRVAGYWFPMELMAQANEGHLHLAEAVLDMNGGGPMHTQEILENIGGIGPEKMELQVFSMSYAMNDDPRFDEVGPTGEVLWFLKRMEPPQVQETPDMLRYEPITYDREALSQAALDLELELGDELSPLPFAAARIKEAQVKVIYPHRRCGTLPINNQAARIFPKARKTERVCVTLIDAADGEEFRGWVVRKGKYVDGLNPMYTKHALPIGSTVRLRRGEESGQIIVDFQAYKPRSEYVTIVNADNNKIGFDTAKRGIGADFDELLLLGVDDLDGVDGLFQGTPDKQQPLATILRIIIPMLGRFTAQG